MRNEVMARIDEVQVAISKRAGAPGTLITLFSIRTANSMLKKGSKKQ